MEREPTPASQPKRGHAATKISVEIRGPTRATSAETEAESESETAPESEAETGTRDRDRVRVRVRVNVSSSTMRQPPWKLWTGEVALSRCLAAPSRKEPSVSRVLEVSR